MDGLILATNKLRCLICWGDGKFFGMCENLGLPGGNAVALGM